MFPIENITSAHITVFLHRDLRFIDVVENVCQRLLEYNLHKERTGSNRFAKVGQFYQLRFESLVLLVCSPHTQNKSKAACPDEPQQRITVFSVKVFAIYCSLLEFIMY